MSDAAIRLDSLGKLYGRQAALADVSLSAAPGERLALLGHNGAGKTTMMKLMLGLTRPSSGRLSVLGSVPGSPDFVARRRRIGYLPESIALYDAMTGAEVLAFFARLKGVDRGECRDLLERVGLSEAAGRRVRTYSKGMQIGRASCRERV